jgi:hypothetical protein
LTGCVAGKTPAPVTVTTTIRASDAEQAQLDQQRAQLEQRQSDLERREAAVSQQEQLAKLSTIATDGTFLVGKEVIPGTYRNSGLAPVTN